VAPLIGQSERGRPAVEVSPGSEDVASAKTQIATSTSSPAAVTAGRSPSRPARAPFAPGRLVALTAVVALTVAGAVVWRGSRTTTPTVVSPLPASSSAQAPLASSVDGSGRAGPSVPGHVPVYPCADTKRSRPAAGLDRKCSDAAVAWCNPSMSVVACCAKGLVPDGEDGACGCPLAPSTDASERPAGCGPATLPPLKAQDIQKIVRARFPELRACYETVLKRAPNAEGRVAVNFEIDPVGDLFFSRVEEGTLPDAAAQKCVLEVFRGLHFPPPSGGKERVLYPISFAPGG
jgi:hypothetical protein